MRIVLALFGLLVVTATASAGHPQALLVTRAPVVAVTYAPAFVPLQSTGGCDYSVQQAPAVFVPSAPAVTYAPAAPVFIQRSATYTPAATVFVQRNAVYTPAAATKVFVQKAPPVIVQQAPTKVFVQQAPTKVVVQQAPVAVGRGVRDRGFRAAAQAGSGGGSANVQRGFININRGR